MFNLNSVTDWIFSATDTNRDCLESPPPMSFYSIPHCSLSPFSQSQWSGSDVIVLQSFSQKAWCSWFYGSRLSSKTTSSHSSVAAHRIFFSYQHICCLMFHKVAQPLSVVLNQMFRLSKNWPRSTFRGQLLTESAVKYIIYHIVCVLGSFDCSWILRGATVYVNGVFISARHRDLHLTCIQHFLVQNIL